ncbi:glutaredoxin family protein [Leucothrix pacifica]|uniref:glutaredoxin family protein n=1 Tax=Leucothrix pacifica TaxID=1247513 RepID=UPI001FE7AFBC|nr:glutaredoxin family protein [Leucothrix pacifica]
MAYENTLIVYYRRGCHLCDEVAVHLRQFQSEFNYELEWVDIDEDPELKRRYDVDVPVVKYRDEVIFYHFFDEEQLRLSFTNASS